MRRPTEVSGDYRKRKRQCSGAEVKMVPSTGKRNFCIRKLKVMLSFDKVTLIQDVGKDSNSVPVYYLSTGLCVPWQLQIFLPHFIEQGALE